MRRAAYCGYCAATRAKVFGWRLHLVCTVGGVPITFDLLPASRHDLTPVHELTAGLPAGASVYADKAFTSAQDDASILAEAGVRRVPIHKAAMRPHRWADQLFLREHRTAMESFNSQLEAMGLQRLRARTHAGFASKVHASLLALVCANAS